jgi:hypothetical protein
MPFLHYTLHPAWCLTDWFIVFNLRYQTNCLRVDIQLECFWFEMLLYDEWPTRHPNLIQWWQRREKLTLAGKQWISIELSRLNCKPMVNVIAICMFADCNDGHLWLHASYVKIKGDSAHLSVSAVTWRETRRRKTTAAVFESWRPAMTVFVTDSE